MVDISIESLLHCILPCYLSKLSYNLQVTPQDCPIGWNSSTSLPEICYRYSYQPDTWTKAVATCFQMNASTLPIFYNQTEFDDYKILIANLKYYRIFISSNINYISVFVFF